MLAVITSSRHAGLSPRQLADERRDYLALYPRVDVLSCSDRLDAAAS
jgi:hypothetical protein